MRIKCLRLFVLFSLLISVPAQAITPSDLRAVQLDTVFYDANATNCAVDVDASLIGSDNIEKAFRYFVQKGLTGEQSAGIVGNLKQESGVNPKSEQHGGGPGRGIAQWSVGGRWDVLLNFADRENRDPLDLGLQLDFIWYEMNERAPWDQTLPALKAATTIEQATEIFEVKYEAAGTPLLDKRIKYAKQVFRLYAGSAGLSVDPDAFGSCNVIGSGQDSKFVDGFLVYTQYDRVWKDKPYGSSTIGLSGCGPAAMAMIITALTGTQVTPVETAEYAANNDYFVDGAGSAYTIAKIGENWGLKVKHIGADLGKIVATLQAGGLVITSAKGSLPFTSVGHIIVIRGVTADGKFKIGDSGHSDTSEAEWDAQQLIATVIASNGGASTHAVTK